MKFVRLIAFVMALFMLFCTIGCGGDEKDSSTAVENAVWGDDVWGDEEAASGNESVTSSSDNNSSGTQSGSSNKLTDTPKTLTLLMKDYAVQPLNSDAVKFKEITEKTGVILDVDVAPEANYSTKVSTLIASGLVPDIMQVSHNLVKTAPAGLFVDVAAIMKKQMPNFYRWVKDDEQLKLNYINGKLYGTVMCDASYYPLAKNPSADAVTGYLPIIRYDILEENNLKTPTTIDEWYTVMKTLKTKYPSSTPWSGRSYHHIVYTGLEMFSGFKPNTAYDYSKKKYTIGVLESGYNRYVELLYKCYQEGILDPNFMSANSNTWEQGVVGNKTFFWVDNNGYAKSQTNALRNSKPNAKMQVMPLMKNYDGKKFALVYAQHTYSEMYTISAKSANKDLIIKFMDWCYSDEGMYVNNYGKEGVTYKKNANGSVTIPQNLVDKYGKKSSPDYAFNSEYGLCSLAFSPLVSRTFSMSATLDKLNKDTFYTENAKITAADKKAGNFYKVIDVTPYIKDTSASEIGTSIDNYIYEQIPKFIKGERSMSEWNAFLSEVKQYGSAEYLKALNNAIK